MPPDTRRREHQRSAVACRVVLRAPCPSLLLLECDTNDFPKSPSEDMDVRLTMQCVRLKYVRAIKSRFVVRVRLATRVRAAKRKAPHVLVPRSRWPRCAPAGVSGHAHRCRWPRLRVSRCQWPRPPVPVATSARQPVSVATPTGVGGHVCAPAALTWKSIEKALEGIEKAMKSIEKALSH